MAVLRVLGVVVAALVGLVVLAAGAAYLLLPTERLVALASAEVARATGRTLTVRGPVTPSLWPVLGVSAGGVALSNAEWAATPQMISVEEAAVGVRLGALLGGRLEIDELRLTGPVIALEVSEAGEANWLPNRDAPAEAVPEAAPDAPAAGGEVGDRGRALALGRLTLVIERGALSFEDRLSDLAVAARDVAVTAEAAASDAPLSVSASGALNGAPVALSATLDSLAAVLAGAQAGLTLDVEAAGARLRYDGSFTAAGATLAGALDVAAPDLAALAALGGVALDPLVAGAALRADVAFGDDRVLRLDGLAATAGEIAAGGAATLDLSGARPRVTADLDLGAVDLTPFLAGRGGAAGDAAGGGAAGAGGGWSTAPIDLTGLRAADADVSLRADSVDLGQGALTDMALRAILQDGALALDIARLSLFGGGLTGRVTATAEDPHRVTAALDLAGVRLRPILTRFAGVDRLTGSGALTTDLTAAGPHLDAMMRSLSGAASVRLTDGALMGLNVAGMVRQATGGGAAGGTQRTDFAEIAASFAVSEGVARNDDLIFLGPLLRAEGAGSIDIGRRTLDYRLTPRAVPTLEGQGGRADQQGLAVPLIIRGPWADPSIRPDLAAAVGDVLQDPAGAARSLGAAGQQAEGARRALEQLPDAIREDPAGAVNRLLQGGGGLGGLLGR